MPCLWPWLVLVLALTQQLTVVFSISFDPCKEVQAIKKVQHACQTPFMLILAAAHADTLCRAQEQASWLAWRFGQAAQHRIGVILTRVFSHATQRSRPTW